MDKFTTRNNIYRCERHAIRFVVNSLRNMQILSTTVMDYGEILPYLSNLFVLFTDKIGCG